MHLFLFLPFAQKVMTCARRQRERGRFADAGASTSRPRWEGTGAWTFEAVAVWWWIGRREQAVGWETSREAGREPVREAGWNQGRLK